MSGFISAMVGGNVTSRLGVMGGSTITLEGTFPDPGTTVTHLRVGTPGPDRSRSQPTTLKRLLAQYPALPSLQAPIP